MKHILRTGPATLSVLVAIVAAWTATDMRADSFSDQFKPKIAPQTASPAAPATAAVSNSAIPATSGGANTAASVKRGVCANKLDPADFKALAPGVSWYYSWNFEETSKPPPDAKIEFVPMAWGADANRLAGLQKYLSTPGVHPRAVFVLNEPNLKGQAFIPPDKTAAFYNEVKAVSDRYHIPLVGPHMSIGSAANASITAMDPIQNKSVTYTFMVPFLKAFMHYTDASHTTVGPIGVHSYGNIGELKWVVEAAYKEFQRPIRVTEYARWGAPDVNAAQKYLVEATEFLESNPHVQGYAWFKERSDNPKISLLGKTPGELSPLGKAYIGVPAHNTKSL